MVFSSIIFLCIFLPVMIIGYYILPKKCRNVFLLIGSLVFYAFGEPKYILLMLASIIGNYSLGMVIHNYALKEAEGNMRAVSAKKMALVVTIIYNLGLLFYFKYFVLIMSTVRDLFNENMTIPEIALPIGISFFTFQGMSYVIDVYREDYKINENGERAELVQKNPVNLALYISMFPQLIAGPIVRYTDIKDYLDNRDESTAGFSRGIERFIVGLAKKAILANSIGEIADKIFTADVNYLGTSVAWIGAIFYTLQIYFDFSGYSDMAIGLGKMFGFEFNENFNYPYISKSITEFWRRWHISLSTWFRDYLYIPLGGNRKGNVYFNLFIVFLATGIWHGAAWGYLIWGLWHGLFMLIERYFRKKDINVKIPSVVKWIYSMLVVVLGWVLFKLEDITLAIPYIGMMFHVKPYDYIAFSPSFYLDNKTIFIVIVGILACLPWNEIIANNSRLAGIKAAISENVLSIAKRITLIFLLLISLIFIVNSTYNPFIYFRF